MSRLAVPGGWRAVAWCVARNVLTSLGNNAGATEIDFVKVHASAA